MPLRLSSQTASRNGSRSGSLGQLESNRTRPWWQAGFVRRAKAHPGTLEAMDWWGIALILAIGIAVVVYGYLDDRRKTRERDAAMQAPP